MQFSALECACMSWGPARGGLKGGDGGWHASLGRLCAANKSARARECACQSASASSSRLNHLRATLPGTLTSERRVRHALSARTSTDAPSTAPQSHWIIRIDFGTWGLFLVLPGEYGRSLERHHPGVTAARIRTRYKHVKGQNRGK